MVGNDAVDQLFDVIEREGRAGDPDAPTTSYVQPGAGRSAVVGRYGDAVTVKVAAPPEGGRANEAVAELLAGALGIPRSSVTLVSGATSRSKRYRVGPVPLDVVRTVIAGAGSDAFGTRGSRFGNVRGRGGVR